jgi:hypothetical protein
MVWTNSEARPRSGNALPNRTTETLGVGFAVGAVVVTIVACWQPIFQVGGFVYTMIDEYRGRDQFLAAAVLPVALGIGALIVGGRQRWTVVAALAATVMCTLAPVDHVTQAAWMREHPERLGAPFEFRVGFLVALCSVVGGALVFVAVVRCLLAEQATDRRHDTHSDVIVGVAAVGLLVAVAGQLAVSSKGRLWELPRWPQVGRWWELIVTIGICGLAMWRRGRASFAAGALVAVVAAVSAGQQLNAVASLEDDPSVSTTVTMVGFAVVAVALSAAFVRSLRRS